MPRLLLSTILSAGIVFAQSPQAGRTQFEGHCAVCHGKDAKGGELGPAILNRIANFNDAELATLIHNGLPNSGMPRNELPAAETQSLVMFLRSLASSAAGTPIVKTTVALA